MLAGGAFLGIIYTHCDMQIARYICAEIAILASADAVVLGALWINLSHGTTKIHGVFFIALAVLNIVCILSHPFA